MKAFMFLTLILIAFCSSLELKFLNNNLSDPQPGELVWTQDCETGSPFEHKKIKATPNIVSKGESMNLKAAVQSDSPQSVRGVLLVAYLNGVQSFTQSKQLNDEVEAGEMYIYSFDVTVPSFIPTGSFDFYFFLVDGEEKHLSCLKGHFYF